MCAAIVTVSPRMSRAERKIPRLATHTIQRRYEREVYGTRRKSFARADHEPFTRSVISGAAS
jgi:hypothetical protein